MPGLSSYSPGGGSALVRRRIQTPSDAKVLSVVQPEEEVVLGASPPARLSSSEIRRASHAMMISDDFGFEVERFLADAGEARHRPGTHLFRLVPWRRHGLGSTGSAGLGGTSFARTLSVRGISRSWLSTILVMLRPWGTF